VVVSEAEEDRMVVSNASVVVKLEVCLVVLAKNDVLLLVIVPIRILMGTKARQVLRFDAAISEQERRSFLVCISMCKEYCCLVVLLL